MLHPTLHQHSTECYAQLLRCLFYSVSQSDQREYTGAKVAHKMLYKLTPLVNFINILRAAFETKILWQNLQSQINIIREKLRKRLSFKKESSNMLVKLTPCAVSRPRWTSSTPVVSWWSNNWYKAFYGFGQAKFDSGGLVLGLSQV